MPDAVMYGFLRHHTIQQSKKTRRRVNNIKNMLHAKSKIKLRVNKVRLQYVGTGSKDPSAGAVFPGAMVEGMSREVLP